MAGISSFLKANGHQTELLIYTAKDDTNILFDKIDKFKPGLIGFSTTTTQYCPVLIVAENIKRSYNIPLIFGGVHPTILPEEVIKEESIDMLCVGEGEYALLELLGKMEKGERINEINNLWVKEGNRIHRNQLRPLIKDLDELPFPDRELFNYEKIADATGVGYIMASRGCPYNCSYCCNHALRGIYKELGQYVRFRSVDNVMEEIRFLIKRYKIKQVFFHDDILPLNKGWIKEFCDKYPREINLPFECYVRPNLADRALFSMLREAGCVRVGMGIESGDVFVRNEIMGRDISQEQIINAFNWARECGLKTYAFNIIGLPGESRRAIWNTVLLNRKVSPDDLQVSFFYPFPRTRLNKYCIERDYGLESIWTPGFFEEPKVKLKGISKIELLFYQRIFRFLVRPLQETKRILRTLFLRLK